MHKNISAVRQVFLLLRLTNILSLTPHISRVSFLRLHLLDVLLSFILAHVAFALDNGQQDVPHVCCHAFSITDNEGEDVQMTLHQRQSRSTHPQR